MKSTMKVIQGDITWLAADVIVNAANSTLLGGGGVDGAIHRAAGPGLQEECKRLGGCKTGEAKLTGGYDLPAGHVIHTVGPVWRGGGRGELELLKNCYWNSLEVASRNRFRTLAFPCISTGAYGYPPEEAAKIAVDTVREHAEKTDNIIDVTFCCFSRSDFDLYRKLLHQDAEPDD